MPSRTDEFNGTFIFALATPQDKKILTTMIRFVGPVPQKLKWTVISVNDHCQKDCGVRCLKKEGVYNLIYVCNL